jgi:hypothetical protein
VTRIIETATGFDLVGDDGAILASHGTMRGALDAARPLLGATQHEPHLREEGEPVGQFAWLDAAAVEPSDPDGFFDADALTELAVSLNTGAMPIPIDGGAAKELSPSPVHGTADDSSTPANGWGHAGVIVERTDGPHLYMLAELWPSVAKDVERGRIAYGSVLAMTPQRAESGAYRGCRLVGHALTNVPVIRTLTPSTAVRAYAHAVRSISMTTKPTDPKAPTKKADPPAAPPVVEAADPPPAEDKDATIAALRSELEAAKSQIEALMTEAAAKADDEPTEEEKTAAAQKAAAVVVDAAVKAGTITTAARAKWIDVVVKSGEKVFADLTRGMRARPVERQVKGPESTTRAVELDASDPFVKTMRAAKVSDASIAKALIERDARKEN